MRPLLVVLLLLLLPAANAIVINEIMYAPINTTLYTEWLEIYNNDSQNVDLTGWKIDGKSISGIIAADDYRIIAKNNLKFLEHFNVSCDVIKVAIVLTNSGKNIQLNDSEDKIIDAVFYNSSWGANGNNKTLSLANGIFVESFEEGGTPCTKNFEEHDISLELEQTNIDEITSHLANNGLNDENITLELFIDGNLSESSELELASFDSGDVTFVLENVSAGEHIALLNATFGGLSVSAELNFSTALPNADVYLEIEINQSINDYSIYNYPENASLSAEVFVMPIGVESADGFTSGYDLNFENNWVDAYTDIIDPEIDFGTYDLCAEIVEIDNYNDTNLENNFVCQNFTIAPPASQTRSRIKTFVENDAYDLNQTLFWTAQLFPLSPGTIGNLTINLQKKTSSDSTELLKIENYNLTENTILSGNFTIPEDWIEGIYKVRTKFKYSEKYFDSRDSGQFWLAGLKDLGQANITILKTPTYLSFGGFGTTVVKFFAGNYNYDRLRFLVYGFPSQVLMDVDGKGLTASSADAAVVVEIPDVKRGESYYLALPKFAKQNCDANYKDDTYRIRVRALQPDGEGWKELTTSDLNLQMAGQGFCPETGKTDTGVKLTGLKLQTQKQKSGPLDISILDAPAIVEVGQQFALQVKVKNNQNITKKFQVYSYIYSGKTVFTDGGWTGNAQMVELSSSEDKTIALDNLVKDDTPLGNYVLRARAKVDGKDLDYDSEIEIVPTKPKEDEETLGNLGSTSNEITATTILWKSEKAGNLSVAALAVIAILLILVVVLIKAHR